MKGTRITVEHLLKLLAQGLSFSDILKDFPHLTRDDISAVLLYAAKEAEPTRYCTLLSLEP